MLLPSSFSDIFPLCFLFFIYVFYFTYSFHFLLLLLTGLPGKRQHVNGSSKCSDCLIGRYMALAVSTNRTCFECPAGFHAMGEQHSSCAACTPGQYSNETGSISPNNCRKCLAGTYSPASGAYSPRTCIECSPGKFGTEVGSASLTICKLCPLGKYTDQSGQIACTTCQVGQTSREKGQTFCTQCEAGMYMSETKTCEQCGTGQYRSTTSSTEIKSLRCVICPIGWSSGAGSTKCILCDAGKFSTVHGQPCRPCLPGLYRPSEVKDATICLLCEKGKYAFANGSTSCIDCSPGRAATLPASTNCEQCSIGQYNTEQGSSSCTAADAGKIVLGGGSTVVVVPKGSFIIENCDSSSSCKPFLACPTGWVGEVPPSSTCLSCAKGQTSFSGSIGCLSCAKGKYNDVVGATNCSDCSEMTYQEQELVPSTFCVDCPSGWQQLEQGKSFCVNLGWLTPRDCNDRQYLNNTARDQTKWSCVICPRVREVCFMILLFIFSYLILHYLFLSLSLFFKNLIHASRPLSASFFYAGRVLYR